MPLIPCLLTLALAAQVPQGPSFDCSKARTPMEKLICSDPELMRLDRNLNTAYRAALARGGDKKTLAEWQRDWLKSYDVEGSTTAPDLARLMTARIDLLDRVATEGPTAAWTGRYVRYWKGKPDRHSAELVLVGLSGGQVHIVGSAVWLGPNAAQGQVHTGELGGTAVLQGGTLKVGGTEEDDCKAQIVLTAEGLRVVSESDCGGMNVTFEGDYRRRK